MPGDDAVIRTRQAYEADAAAWTSRRSDRTYWATRVGDFVSRLDASGRNRRLLDLGSGPGVGSAELASHRLDVVAYDVTRAMLEIARTRTRGAVALVQGDSRSLPFADGAFGAVWASASLLHLPKAEASAALREVARVLTPGGLFYSSMKQGDQDGLDAPRSGSDIRAPRHFSHYGVSEWSRRLADAGFEIRHQAIEVDGRPDLPDWIVTTAERT